MDLIYADGNLTDLGVLQDYSLDMEYGVNSTNDFEVKVQKYNHVCNQDYLLYVEFTEYGGVIDRIESDTQSGVVTYKGRTWHGLLNSIVIEPPSGKIYRVFDGDANAVLAEIIALTGLDIFEVDSEVSGINISAFTTRYEHAYDLILRMLDEYNAKMYCYWKNGKVYIGAMLAINYATNEEFDSSQVPFKVGISYNNVNHLICLGKGDGADRAVIHLFCDEGGAIQPYRTTNTPLQDSDYILDKSRQVMTGREEITEIFDKPNSNITINYIALTTKPADWDGMYANYFQIKTDSNGTPVVDDDGDVQYEKIKRVYKDEYHLQFTKPADWSVETGYQNYYYWDDNADAFKSTKNLALSYSYGSALTTKPKDWEKYYGKYYEYDSTEQSYSPVQPAKEIYHMIIPKKPKDWTWRYGSYQYKIQTGVGWEFHNIEGIPIFSYVKTKTKPDTWSTDWRNYYVILKAGKYEDGTKIVKYSGGYYTVDYAVNTAKVIALQKGKTYPKWGKNKFYIRNTTYKAPKFSDIQRLYDAVLFEHSEDVFPPFESGRYYKRTATAPQWQAKTFYTLYEDVEQIPRFVANQYFKALEDRYAVLVADGIKKLEGLRDTSTLDIDLQLESNYDVGDVIGSEDEVTGIAVNKPILKKIIKIQKNIVSVEYQVD